MKAIPLIDKSFFATKTMAWRKTEEMTREVRYFIVSTFFASLNKVYFLSSFRLLCIQEAISYLFEDYCNL